MKNESLSVVSEHSGKIVFTFTVKSLKYCINGYSTAVCMMATELNKSLTRYAFLRKWTLVSLCF